MGGPCGLRGTLWTRGDWGAGLSILLARLCLRARAVSVLLCPDLVRGTMEALQHVPALELQLQVRGGAAGDAQPCQPSPGPRPAHSSQSAGGRCSEGPRVLVGRALVQAPPGGIGGGGVTRGREALKPCRRPPEGATGGPEPLETRRRGPASPQPTWEQPALSTMPCSLHPDLALWVKERPRGHPGLGPPVIQGGLCLFSWRVETWGPRGTWKPRKPDLTPLVAPWWPLQVPPHPPVGLELFSCGQGPLSIRSQGELSRALCTPWSRPIPRGPTGHRDTPIPEPLTWPSPQGLPATQRPSR